MSPVMSLVVRQLGNIEYLECWQNMVDFTDNRQPDTADELWFLQHPAVYTQGKNGKAEHILNSADIPVINSDRGGQVTYHGPGQIIVYTLLDLKRLNLGVRELVTVLEHSVIELLDSYGVSAKSRRDAPGVYVKDAKIAALGLRVRKGCSFHGLALNVDMDLEPYSQINPCGYEALEVTQLKHYISDINVARVAEDLQRFLVRNLNYE